MVKIKDKQFSPALFAQRLCTYLDPNSRAWNKPPKIDPQNSSRLDFSSGSQDYQIDYSEKDEKLFIDITVSFKETNGLERITSDESVQKSLKKDLSNTTYKFFKDIQVKSELEKKRISVSTQIDDIPLGKNDHLSESLEKGIKNIFLKTIYGYLK